MWYLIRVSDLVKVVDCRDPGEICAALHGLKKEEYGVKFKEDILKAEKNIRGLKDTTFKKLDMPRKQLTQMHSFQNPPEAMAGNVKTMLMMLGETEDKAQVSPNTYTYVTKDFQTSGSLVTKHLDRKKPVS